MPDDVKAFYEYHASLMEPWDGPAAVVFTDGRVIGAKLDRNGLRPGRYLVTADGLVVMASEAGVLPIKPEDIRMKGRLAPGRMLLVDTEQKRLISDEEVKKQLAARQPYAQWVRENQITLDHLPSPAQRACHQSRNDPDAPARLRLHGRRPEDDPAPGGHQGRGAHRLDGNRHAAGVPFGQAAAAVQLFQADLRAGDQPGDRPDPRGPGDVAQQLHRARRQHPRRNAEELPHAEAAPSDYFQLAPRKAAQREMGRLPRHHSSRALPRRRRRDSLSRRPSKSFAAPLRRPSRRETRC